MLVFSAIVPHSPILIPNIGGENTNKLQKTITSLNLLRDELEKADPDTIIIISPHGEINFEAFSINTHQTYKANFQDFGDFETDLEFKSDLNFVMSIKNQINPNVPIQLISHENLDHGVSVPLYYVLKDKTKRIVPINYSHLSYAKHVEFGEMLKEAIFDSDKKYAILASGDLSHKLSKNAPEGFSPQAKEFDKKIIQNLKKKNLSAILDMDRKLIKNASECGLRSILVLLGVIKNMNYEFEVLSYESPFGVGYLVGEFKLL